MLCEGRYAVAAGGSGAGGTDGGAAGGGGTAPAAPVPWLTDAIIWSNSLRQKRWKFNRVGLLAPWNCT